MSEKKENIVKVYFDSGRIFNVNTSEEACSSFDLKLKEGGKIKASPGDRFKDNWRESEGTIVGKVLNNGEFNGDLVVRLDADNGSPSLYQAKNSKYLIKI